MSGLTAFTLFHVLLSLVGIATGLVVVWGFITANRISGWTTVFLLTTVATTVTGFLFPFNGFTPAIGTGIVSAIVLIPTLAARYVFRLAGSWRWVYVAGSVVALYLNTFVLVVQAFLKVPPLHTLAPNGSEPPFTITQGVVLILFVILAILSLMRFRPPAMAT